MPPRGAKDKSQWWNAGNSWDSTPAKQKGKGHGKATQAAGSSFPGYDSSQGASSATSSTMPGIKDIDLKAMLSAVLEEHNMDVPKELQSYLQPPLGDQLSTDQKKLNAKRKLVTKLDRLGKAMTRKKDQWVAFRNQMKEHLAKEKARYEQELEEIQTAIATTQSQLDLMMAGVDPEPSNQMEGVEQELEEMLQEGKEGKPQTEKTCQKAQDIDTLEALRQAQLGQQFMAKQLQDMQQQILLMTHSMKPMIGSPQPAGHGTPGLLQGPFTPMKTKAHAAATPKGPYAKVEVEDKNKQDKTPDIIRKKVDVEVLSD